MKRRRFVVFVGGTLAMPLACFAQQPVKTMPRIAFLGAASAAGYAARVDALRKGFRDLGYEEGRNMTLEFRWAEGRYDRLPELATELVRLKFDVIVTHSSAPTLAAKKATEATQIPVVMTNVGDAVAWGIVPNLPRPGGNITGDTFLLTELAAKRLEVLRDAVPRVQRVAILANPDNPGTATSLVAMETAAKSLKLALHRFDVRGPAELETVFAEVAARHCDALAVLEDPRIIVSIKKIAELAAARRLPSIGAVEYAETGGLIGYGVDFLALYRRAAVFVDKILKGAKPADIPVERPTRFELAINSKTAGALGLKIPQATLLRATRVIE